MRVEHFARTPNLWRTFWSASNDHDVFLTERVEHRYARAEGLPVVPTAQSQTMFDRGHHMLLLVGSSRFYLWQDADHIRFSRQGWEAPRAGNKLPGNSDPRSNQLLLIDENGVPRGFASDETDAAAPMADAHSDGEQELRIYVSWERRAFGGDFHGEPHTLELLPPGRARALSVVSGGAAGAGGPRLLKDRHADADWYVSPRAARARGGMGDVLELVRDPGQAVRLAPSFNHDDGTVIFLRHGHAEEVALTLDTRGNGIDFQRLRPRNEISVIQHFAFRRVPPSEADAPESTPAGT